MSGKYKGQHLVSFKADHIRPTTDRVKETLFNIIQNEVAGARCLDLFSGTGNLGLEALSRGAATVQFVDMEMKSISILKQNLEKLKVTEPFQITKADVLKFLRSYRGDPFDLIFIDPPFTKQMAHDVIGILDSSQVYNENTLIAIESGRRENLLQDYPNLVRYDVREFGDKSLSFFKKREAESV